MATEYLATLPEWQPANKQRLQYLFSNFASAKQTNPESFNATVSQWHRLLADLTPHLSRDQLVLHIGDGLVEALTTENVGRPTALGVETLARTPPYPLISLKEFLQSKTRLENRNKQSWTGWAARNLVGRPLWWALQQAHILETDDGSSSSPQDLWKTVQGDWVFIRSVKDHADRIIQKQREMADSGPIGRLFSFESFRTTFFPNASPADLEIVLKFLARDCDVLRFDSEKSIVKFSPSETPDDEREITAVDHGILQVYQAQSSLQNQVSSIETRIAEKHSKVADLVKRNQKDQAMAILRSKKALQELLLRRSGALETIDKLALGIETASGDLEILKAYNTASATLRKILDRPEMSEDKISQTMDDVADTLADQQEVSDLISQGSLDAVRASGVDVADESDLEAELAGLASLEDDRSKAEHSENRRSSTGKSSEEKVAENSTEEENSKETESRKPEEMTTKRQAVPA